MQKQLLRSLARSGRSALLELLYNDKRNISSISGILQRRKVHTHSGQQSTARAFSLAVAAEKTSSSEASECFSLPQKIFFF